MKNKFPTKNNRPQSTGEKLSGRKINNLFNKSNHPKQEEAKNNKEGKDSKKQRTDQRIKTSRSKHHYKLSYSRNFNDYKQILTELTDINTSKVNWAIKLRKDQLIKVLDDNPKNNKVRKISSAKPSIKGLKLTSNFIEPKFYMDDLEKYKLKIKKRKRPISSILNPNFNNVKHLFSNKINHQSKDFASSLRNYNSTKNKKEKIKWNNNFMNINTNSDNRFYTKFLLPRTEEGKKNFRRIEKKMISPFCVTYKNAILGNDTIKQKVLLPKKDFSYYGTENYLDLGNYRTNYGIKNSGLCENILKAENNSQCLFELGLRNYPKMKVKS